MPQSGTDDDVTEWLKSNGEPVTRENYIDLAYLGKPPKPWTAELEAGLPPELRDFSKVKTT